MRRMLHDPLWRLLLGTTAVVVVAWILMAALGLQVMPSYLAAWLFCLALPLGALPVVMLLELVGVTDWAVLPPLRRILLLQPAASLFAIPVLLGAGTLYHRAAAASPPGRWMATGPFDARMVASLLAWTGLALLFARQPRGGPRQGIAALGLCLHLVIGTLAALDWVMALDPGLNSSAFGLIAISMQVSTALCVAVLVLALRSHGRALPTEATPLLLTALGAWMFLHFIQFLVIWSGNLPKEIVWYQHRIGGLGATALWFGFTAAILTLAALLPRRFSRTPWVLASVAVMLLLVHLVETLWLVTPGFRGHFTLSLPDLPALLAVAALAGGLLASARAHAEKLP
jgi:hypothetical protein